ncbi:TPA: hypothetical protein ACIVON_005006 [Salmonella enterica subsp. enterica serovar Poona]
MKLNQKVLLASLGFIATTALAHAGTLSEPGGEAHNSGEKTVVLQVQTVSGVDLEQLKASAPTITVDNTTKVEQGTKMAHATFTGIANSNAKLCVVPAAVADASMLSYDIGTGVVSFNGHDTQVCSDALKNVTVNLIAPAGLNAGDVVSATFKYNYFYN